MITRLHSKRDKDIADFFKLEQPKMTTGKVIRAFRKNFGFTLEDIQTLTGIKTTNLSAIGHDKRPVSMDAAVKLAAIFGLDPGNILFPNGTDILDKPEYKRIHQSAFTLRERKLAHK